MYQSTRVVPPLKRRSLASWRSLASLGTTARFLTLLLVTVFFIAPFVWLIITALKRLDELSAFPFRWLPAQLHWENFVKAVTLIDFPKYLINSLVLSTLYAVTVTLSSALVGFGFARLRGWGKQVLFTIMISTLMLPPILTTIPTFVLFSKLGLVNTYWPWFMWGLASTPFLSFLFRQFFSSIPPELEEAAIVDGCRYGHIFWRIFLPLSRPVLATAFILSFASVWGDWLAPALFLTSDNTTLSVAMSSGYTDPNIPNFVLSNILSAGIVLYVLPVVLIFFFAQRAFTQGIFTTGLK